MNKLTAIEWLRSEFLAADHSTTKDEMYITLPKNALQKAIEMEQEQHREQWHKGWQDAFDMVEHFREQGVTIITKNNEQTKQS